MPMSMARVLSRSPACPGVPGIWGEPGGVGGCVLLGRVAEWGDTRLVKFAPPRQESLGIGLELALLGEALGMPPPVRLLEDHASPSLGHLSLVAVVEAFEHHVHPRLAPLASHRHCVLDGRDTTSQCFPLVLEVCQVRLEGGDLVSWVRVTCQCFADRTQSQASFTQEQAALQSCHGDGSVVAVAVRADTVRDEQADLMIVTQCPGADAGAVSEFLDGRLRHLGLSRQRAGIVRPNCGSATARISEAGVATALAGDCPVASRKADTMRAPAA